MRVIAGKARSIQLTTIEGTNTRPTTDRIKETLFNMLQPYLFDSKFLDLFSGSGAIGIEALSRGAKYCVFVEKDKRAVDCIHYNLKKTKFSENAKVINSDVYTALNRLEDEKIIFDVVFMDPPYNLEEEKRVLEYLKDSRLINEETLIIAETSLTTKLNYLNELNYEIIKEKSYKNNQHIFMKHI